MANSNNYKKVVPAAKDALNKFKYEVASDMSVKNIFINNTKIICYFIFFTLISRKNHLI